MNDDTTTSQILRITQQNCKFSKAISTSIINDTNPDDWDIILLQDPYIYPNTRFTIASRNWISYYPPKPPNNDDANQKPRCAILVNKNISTGTYSQLEIHSQLLTVLKFSTLTEEIVIINIYNLPNNNQALHDLGNWLRRTANLPTRMIWAGDFNKHHAL